MSFTNSLTWDLLAGQQQKLTSWIETCFFSFSFMFWTDWGDSPRIEKCGMNGDPKTREVLISRNILWPNALTIDYTVDRIWWADAKLHTIESSDLDGRKRRLILFEDVTHPFALTLFQNYMYWTDWEHRGGSINKANKFNGQERSVIQENLYSPMDIQIGRASCRERV